MNKIVVPYFGGGVILETQNSYHFIGCKIFKQSRFSEFMGRSLISSTVTIIPDSEERFHEHISDYRFIGYSLLRDFTCLRITTNGEKKFRPVVIAEI